MKEDSHNDLSMSNEALQETLLRKKHYHAVDRINGKRLAVLKYRLRVLNRSEFNDRSC